MMEDKEELGKENETDEELLETQEQGQEQDGGDDADESDDTPGLERNLGTQPIDEVMTTHELKNHDVMQMNRGGLTHKMVQKARKGRRLKPNIKVRITAALNAALKQRGVEEQYALKQLFNY